MSLVQLVAWLEEATTVMDQIDYSAMIVNEGGGGGIAAPQAADLR